LVVRVTAHANPLELLFAAAQFGSGELFLFSARKFSEF